MIDIDFEKFEQLSEEEQQAIIKTWGEREWCDYFEKDGYVSCEDFFSQLKSAVIGAIKERNGRRNHKDSAGEVQSQD